jgi:hypothetical protein
MLVLVSSICNVARLLSSIYLLSFKLRPRENACGSVGVSVSCVSYLSVSVGVSEIMKCLCVRLGYNTRAQWKLLWIEGLQSVDTY